MDLVLRRGTRRYYAQQLGTLGEFEPPDWGEPYACLLWDSRGSTSGSERASLAEALLSSGCRYVCAAGADSEAWHDAVDEAFLPSILGCSDEELNERLVMTTWHSGEDEERVSFFFVRNTDFNDIRIRRLLLVHIGHAPRTMRRLRRAIRRHAFRS